MSFTLLPPGLVLLKACRHGGPAFPHRGSPPALPPLFCSRHLKEISELQSQQKQEIEALYRRLGKPLPPNVGFFHTAPPMGRRRKSSKNKLKAGKLLNPLVQQLKVVASSTGLLLLGEGVPGLRREGTGGPQVSLRG